MKTTIFLLGLFLSLSSIAQSQPDTLIFKIRDRINDYQTDVRNFDLRWSSSVPGQPFDSLALNTDLQGDVFDNIWLWQTYNYNKSKSTQVISPKLPAGCELDYMILSFVETKKDFHLVLGFEGRSCIELKELLTKEKLKILFTDVPVYEENTIKDKLYMLIDDLHHSHMTTNAATKKYETYVNSTDHKKYATYVSFDFPVPQKFDSCEDVAIGDIIPPSLMLASTAKSLTSNSDPISFIDAIGEFSNRVMEMADSKGLGLVKKCVKKEQFLSPAPRNGLLKKASSTFFFSLSSDFKMLLQSNKSE